MVATLVLGTSALQGVSVRLRPEVREDNRQLGHPRQVDMGRDQGCKPICAFPGTGTLGRPKQGSASLSGPLQGLLKQVTKGHPHRKDAGTGLRSFRLVPQGDHQALRAGREGDVVRPDRTR
jgi:hypothetical protein